MSKMIVLSGPTASGKSAVSLRLAEKFNNIFEIVSADSVQVYRRLNIGSSKPESRQMNLVPHHLIDIIEPESSYNAGQFADDADSVCRGIFDRGRIPLFVGGTGLYLEAFFEGLSRTPLIEQSFVKDIEAEAVQKGWAALYSELVKADSPAAEKIHPNDSQRITRALSVFRATGVPISEYRRARKPAGDYSVLFLSLETDRALLYERINRRTDMMLKSGWVDEVRGLLSSGLSPDSPSMRTIGYSRIINFIEGELSLDCASEMIKHDTRRYAKKQIIWLRRKNYYQQIDAEDFNGIADKVGAHLNSFGEEIK